MYPSNARASRAFHSAPNIGRPKKFIRAALKNAKADQTAAKVCVEVIVHIELGGRAGQGSGADLVGVIQGQTTPLACSNCNIDRCRALFPPSYARRSGRSGVALPATSGKPHFERIFRVHQNTLEGMPIFLRPRRVDGTVVEVGAAWLQAPRWPLWLDRSTFASVAERRPGWGGWMAAAMTARESILESVQVLAAEDASA